MEKREIVVNLDRPLRGPAKGVSRQASDQGREGRLQVRKISRDAVKSAAWGEEKDARDHMGAAKF